MKKGEEKEDKKKGKREQERGAKGKRKAGNPNHNKNITKLK